jgi:putative transposase
MSAEKAAAPLLFWKSVKRHQFATQWINHMMRLLAVIHLCRALLAARASLVAENLALRQQITVLQRSVPRPRLRARDRLFWVWLSRWFGGWRSWLAIVKPATVIAWHRQGFRLFWRRKSPGAKPGRPPIPPEMLALIRRMARDNPTWGAPRITSELRLLGHELAESTVSKYLPKGRKPPSQTWKAFLNNHAGCLVSCDFFTVPTATFRVLYCFILLAHDRRRLVHFHVTAKPSAAWVGRQIRQAFPSGAAPRFLLHDRESCYGELFHKAVADLGIAEVVTAPRSPWQSPYVERLIGSIRRECLDHLIVLNERHLLHILRLYFAYYHLCRTHLALDRNAPVPRAIEPPERGRVIAIPHLGGLHHRYTRAA